LNTAFSEVGDWLKEPFTPGQANPIHWFLFIGFLIVSLYMWRTIIRDVSRVAGAAV
jgi:hypothetical protein